MIRKIGFGLLVVAALVVTFVAAPEPPEEVSTRSFDRQLSQALDDYAANDARTQGAPQQQVVNGWIARDLLSIQTEQMNALLSASQQQAADPRVPLLLLLVMLAVALHAVTLPTPLVVPPVREPAFQSSGDQYAPAGGHAQAAEVSDEARHDEGDELT